MNTNKIEGLAAVANHIVGLSLVCGIGDPNEVSNALMRATDEELVAVKNTDDAINLFLDCHKRYLGEILQSAKKESEPDPVDLSPLVKLHALIKVDKAAGNAAMQAAVDEAFGQDEEADNVIPFPAGLSPSQLH